LKSDIILRSGACPDCGAPMEHESGCVVCRSCGYSECGWWLTTKISEFYRSESIFL